MPDLLSPQTLIAELCGTVGLPDDAARHNLDLSDTSNCLRSSFAVGLAAQSSIGAAAAAACEIDVMRTGRRQRVRVTRCAAERECTGFFRLDGITPDPWDEFSGLYETLDGHVRVHANFKHHRDGALALLGLSADRCSKADMAAALRKWRAADYEQAAAEQGLVVAMVRTFDQWDTHPHARANADAVPISLTKIGDGAPRPLPGQDARLRPLSGLRFLDLTRILAGPICGRTLAAYGGDVLLLNAPHLPNIASIVDTSRGKRSAELDLRSEAGRNRLHALLQDTDAFIQGYRPGGLAQLGFSPEQLAGRYPGIIYTSLTAYGTQGPWAQRRGFDSLVQTATGFNHAEQSALATELPTTLPVPILDYASGFLLAFGTQAALLKRAVEGGSWHVQVSLLHTASWLRRMGRTSIDAAEPVRFEDCLASFPCTQGQLLAMPHAAEFERTPAGWDLPSVPVGTHAPTWSRSA